jgi:hypothetical protein
MKLGIFGYYEITSGGICQIINITNMKVSYLVYDRNGKKLPSIILGGIHTCKKQDFINVIVRRVKPKVKPKFKPRIEKRWEDMGRVKNYSSYHEG